MDSSTSSVNIKVSSGDNTKQSTLLDNQLTITDTSNSTVISSLKTTISNNFGYNDTIILDNSTPNYPSISVGNDTIFSSLNKYNIALSYQNNSIILNSGSDGNIGLNATDGNNSTTLYTTNSILSYNDGNGLTNNVILDAGQGQLNGPVGLQISDISNNTATVYSNNVTVTANTINGNGFATMDSSSSTVNIKVSSGDYTKQSTLLDNQLTITDTSNSTVITTNEMTINSIVLNTYTLPSSGMTAGQIVFDGTHFYGYNGTIWKQLDN
jgi:hypothetical protein